MDNYTGYEKGWRNCLACGCGKPLYTKRVRIKPDGSGKLWTIKCSKCGAERETEIHFAARLPSNPAYYARAAK